MQMKYTEEKLNTFSKERDTHSVVSHTAGTAIRD